MSTIFWKIFIVLTIVLFSCQVAKPQHENLFAKKWLITTIFHPGNDMEGEEAEPNSYLNLKEDGSYTLYMYDYLEEGSWYIQTPRPATVKDLGSDIPMEKNEEVLILTPSKKEGYQTKIYVVVLKQGKLNARSTFDPTGFEAIPEQ